LFRGGLLLGQLEKCLLDNILIAESPLTDIETQRWGVSAIQSAQFVRSYPLHLALKAGV
jgi:hypothetical protein